MTPRTRVLYERKVRVVPGGGFYEAPEAFQGVLKQRWAMFAAVNNIKMEMGKATPQQICRLAWVPHCVTYDNMLCPLAAKRSHFKNILNRGSEPFPIAPFTDWIPVETDCSVAGTF